MSSTPGHPLSQTRNKQRPSTGVLRKPVPASGHRVAYGDLQRPRARPASTGPYSAANMTPKVTVARPKTALGRSSYDGSSSSKSLNQVDQRHNTFVAQPAVSAAVRTLARTLLDPTLTFPSLHHKVRFGDSPQVGTSTVSAIRMRKVTATAVPKSMDNFTNVPGSFAFILSPRLSNI